MKGLALLPLLLATGVLGTLSQRQVYLHGWKKQWVESKHRPDYSKFQLIAGRFYRDKRTKVSRPAKMPFYALSTRFKPFSNENETLVVQFSVKYKQSIDCGGRTGKTDFIPDPNAKKPEDWNEAMDGEWEGPLIPNLKYKGQWKPQIIDNPNYQGEWIHPEIDNPKYKPDPTICHYYNISVLGLDLWQVKSGSIFDNSLLTNDEKFAEVVGNKTRGIRKDIEKQWRELYEEMEKRKQQEEAKKNEKEKEREGDIGGTEEEGSKEYSAEESGTNRQLKEADAERAFLDKHVKVHVDQKDKL